MYLYKTYPPPPPKKEAIIQETSPVADAIELSELSEAEGPSNPKELEAHKEDVLYVKWHVCKQNTD